MGASGPRTTTHGGRYLVSRSQSLPLLWSRSILVNVQFEEVRPVVVVIDDDDNVREALDSLFCSVGLLVRSFSSGRQFLETVQPDTPGCMVLDVRLPGQNGLDFHDELIKARLNRPVVFISGHADVPMSGPAMKAGAVEFLTKPVRDQDLLDAVNLAIEKDRVQRHRARQEKNRLARVQKSKRRENERSWRLQRRARGTDRLLPNSHYRRQQLSFIARI